MNCKSFTALFFESESEKKLRLRREAITRATVLLRAVARRQGQKEKARLSEKVDAQVQEAVARGIALLSSDYDDKAFALDEPLDLSA